MSPATATATAATATAQRSTSSLASPLPLTSHSLLQWFIAHTSDDSRSLLSGGVAGCVAKTFTAPLDRVKILFQGSNPNVAVYTRTWTGPFEAVRFIYRTEGARAIFKGHLATLLRIFPYAALNFYCYDRYKRVLVSELNRQRVTGLSENALLSVVAGSAAGATSVFFTYPLDYVHSRITYQVKLQRYRGIIQTIRSTLTEGMEHARHEGRSSAVLPFYGVRKLYTGFGATVLGILPYAGVSFATYDTLKRWTTKQLGETEPNALIRLSWGAVAGAAAQTASYPFDVIRRRMQLYGLSSALPRYHHTLHAITDILRHEGVRGLYIGLTINYWKVAPTHAISFFVYDTMKKTLDVKIKRPH